MRAARADLVGASVLAIGIMIAFEPGIFLGYRLIGFDSTSLVYPWYVNALIAFHHNPFVSFNPYQDGGMVNFNLLANYDPIYFIPLLTGAIPNLYQEQLLVLAHLALVPLCLIALARLYGVSGAKLYLVGVLGAVAAFTGFDLKYMETTEAIDGYAWGLLCLTAIEYYRVRKRLSYAIVAALALDFAFTRFAKGTVYWPLFIVPYIAVFWSEFRSRTLVRDVAIATAVFFAVALPSIIEMQHMWISIEASKFLSVELEGAPRDILAYFGFYLAPLSAQGQSIYAIPGVIGIMLLVSFARMSTRERWFFGIVLGALLLYALGSATPMEWIVRHTFPPADVFRRAYEELYVALPILFMVVVRYFIAAKEEWAFNPRWRIGIITALGLLAVLGIVVSPESRPVDLTVVACSIAFLYTYRQPVAIGALITTQWVLIAFLPVAQSIFYPHPPGIVQDEISANYQGIEPYLTPRTTDAEKLYRVVGVGVNANFGPYAGVYRFYNLAPDDGTRIPRALYEETRLADPLFSGIAQSLRANPAIVASPALRAMSVRYYFFRPEVSDIAAAARRRHPELRYLPNPDGWLVLEDPLAHPFISALTSDSRLIRGVPGYVDWDTVRFRFPRGAAYVDLSYLYDDWWHVEASDGARERIVDRDGQLRIAANGLQGKRVTLRYQSSAFTVALVLQLLCYLVLAAGALAIGARAMLRVAERVGRRGL